MIWLLTIPFIVYFTFSDLIASGFPSLDVGNSRNFLEWCFLIFTGCFISFLISLVPIILSAIISSRFDRKGVKDSEYPLVRLREASGIEGNFFLGSGFIGDCQYYFWYRKHSDGSIRGGKTRRHENVRIYESDKQPIMVTFKTEYVNKKWQKYVWIFCIDFRSDLCWSPDFYIPKNSIKEGYSLE